MMNKIRMMALTLTTAAALMLPSTTMARDRDDYYRHLRHERHERWERHHRYLYHDYYPYAYRHGYYRHGYYDRWGYWHPSRW